MNLKIVLYEINYQSEIIEIFKNTKVKIDNIKVLWDKLKEYREKLQYNRENIKNYDKQINNLYKISSFVEDMLLNSNEATVNDFRTEEIMDKCKVIRDFINDWNNIVQIRNIKYKINKLEENKKILMHSISPFNENFNFNINRETTLKKINFIDKEILKFKQELEKINYYYDEPVLTTDDIYIINSDDILEIIYGKNCPPCTIL